MEGIGCIVERWNKRRRTGAVQKEKERRKRRRSGTAWITEHRCEGKSQERKSRQRIKHPASFCIKGSKEKLELRTDLALEEKERFQGNGGEVKGVSLREWDDQEQGIRITEVKILNEHGAKAMGKEMGTYLTIEAQGIEQKSEEFQDILAKKVAIQLKKLLYGLEGRTGQKQQRKNINVLVAGLGNLYMAPDSLGPRVLQHLPMTRHYDAQYGRGFLHKHHMASISGIVPGVMAQTGMETAEILNGVVNETKPDLVIAIDALAARSVHRLGCTIQLSDTGIRPGSGVGNHRSGLTKESLGVPVLAVGVPTVVGAAAIVQDTISAMIKALESGNTTQNVGRYLEKLGSDEQYALIRELLEPEFGPMFVTPPDIEERVELLSKVISDAVKYTFS